MHERPSAPAYVRRLARRIASLFKGSHADAEMSDEMRLHIDLQAEEFQKEGMTLEEATDRARRAFGHLDGVKEACRDERDSAGPLS